METQTLVEKLLEECKFHDWYYEYSDDYKAWSEGNRHRGRMHEAFRALANVDKGLAVDTWNSVAPQHFQYVKD